LRVDSDYTPQQVAELLSRGEKVQLIDVRQDYEHEAGRIAGDRWIELGQLTAQAETIDRDAPVIFYCRSGARSQMATEAFRNAGFDAHNLVGGLLSWDRAGLPLEPDDGYVENS
jgi:rhodanese-related sulfurtransferase